jgi:hypothetical protein
MRRSSAWLQGMALYCERMDAQEQCLAQGMALYCERMDAQEQCLAQGMALYCGRMGRYIAPCNICIYSIRGENEQELCLISIWLLPN